VPNSSTTMGQEIGQWQPDFGLNQQWAAHEVGGLRRIRDSVRKRSPERQNSERRISTDALSGVFTETGFPAPPGRRLRKLRAE
jgi:hypothetical protein